MKELKIEHLAAYLPYGVNLSVELFGGLDSVIPLVSQNPYSDIRIGIPIGQVEHYGARLILRPLSDLTREITHNGETFVPMDRLDPVLRLVHNKYVNDWGAVGWMDVDSWPYPLVKQLHSWHFDTFGLLESNLAIDINTIKPQSK